MFEHRFGINQWNRWEGNRIFGKLLTSSKTEMLVIEYVNTYKCISECQFIIFEGLSTNFEAFMYLVLTKVTA